MEEPQPAFSPKTPTHTDTCMLGCVELKASHWVPISRGSLDDVGSSLPSPRSQQATADPVSWVISMSSLVQAMVSGVSTISSHFLVFVTFATVVCYLVLTILWSYLLTFIRYNNYYHSINGGICRSGSRDLPGYCCWVMFASFVHDTLIPCAKTTVTLCRF